MADAIVMPTHGNFKNLTGMIFGQLTVIAYAGKRGRYTMWLCRCKCGKETQAIVSNLCSGGTQSCGCLQRKKTVECSRTHGYCGTPEYVTWRSMKQRCGDPSQISYDDYGGRGITVCDRWRDSFEAFLADMGERPSKNHSIDRVDNSKGYSKSNCRWATNKEQGRNTRRNRMLTLNGRTLCVAEWAERLGMSDATILSRLGRGWSVERALTTPVKGSR